MRTFIFCNKPSIAFTFAVFQSVKGHVLRGKRRSHVIQWFIRLFHHNRLPDSIVPIFALCAKQYLLVSGAVPGRMRHFACYAAVACRVRDCQARERSYLCLLVGYHRIVSFGICFIRHKTAKLLVKSA